MTFDEREALLKELEDITGEMLELAKRLYDVAAQIAAEKVE